MVHDNPGEPRFETSFRKPEKLIQYGYNTQVYRYFATTVPFQSLGEDYFASDDAKKWLKKGQSLATEESNAAHEAGLMTLCHMDLFVLPKQLVEQYKDEICDESGRISIFKEKTKEIHRILFQEMFAMYPLDGVIIRVGETYLHDTPYHVGNGAVPYGDKEKEKAYYVELIKFLREEVCVKNNKFLIFRTWDCYADRFHADKDYYLDITEQIESHEKLIFSIKHTALDFWRRVQWNPCLCTGNHYQIIEVQCQREYEGKGAYPMYVMHEVIHGSPELKNPVGISDVIDNPLIRGIFAWSRGGGWYGPYIKNEFWCDLNSYVIGMYGKDSSKNEEEIFLSYAKEKMGLSTNNAKKFYALCRKIPEAVLRSRYVEAYDTHLNEKIMPTELWLRDDRMAGLRQLNVMFDYLEQHDLMQEAIEEREQAIKLWKDIRDDFKAIDFADYNLQEFIANSIEYAIRFFEIVRINFHIFYKCRRNEGMKDLLKEYDEAWVHFRELEQRPQASTCYCEEYIFSPNNLGLNETIDYCRKNLDF